MDPFYLMMGLFVVLAIVAFLSAVGDKNGHSHKHHHLPSVH